MNTSTSSTSTTTTPCPLESALGDDAQAIDQLRCFRDGTLAHSAIGLEMTALYYANAESITAALDRSPQLKAFTRRTLTLLAPLLTAQEK
ncbi:MAG: hypothetical protein JW832_05555 [Deltaproteobacteria bacterium]|nr:hypothetical protein [Deltaproteobacteria bacterium]